MSFNNKLTAIADAIRRKTGGTATLTLDEMATEVSGIEPGVGLNFKVVGGTSAPVNPRENTIWVNTESEITGWEFSNDVLGANLLDFKTWSRNIGVANGSKLVTGNSITLSANGNADCYTSYGSDSAAKISCEPGKTYVLEWEHSGTDGKVYIFPLGSTTNMVFESSSLTNKIEYTATSGVTFFTFRFGVYGSYKGAVYSNIRIYEKPDAIKEGYTWIETSSISSCEFNALQDNNITVYPIHVKQYISGKWVDKDAKIYQNGAWKDWTRYLFSANNLHINITGGWASGYYEIGELPFYGNGGSQSIGNTMYIHWARIPDTAYHGAAFYVTRKKIDLTNVKNIKISCTTSGYLNFCHIGVSSISQKPWPDNSAYWQNCAATAKLSTGTITLDVSGLSGSYYVMIGGSTEDEVYSPGTVSATEVWME